MVSEYAGDKSCESNQDDQGMGVIYIYRLRILVRRYGAPYVRTTAGVW